MSDYPAGYFDLGAPGDLYSVGQGSQAFDAVNNASTVVSIPNLGINVVIYVPVMVPTPRTVYGAKWLNGSTVSGNVDAGVMDAEGNLVVKIGSTAQAGITAMQTASFGTPAALVAGLYYIAFTQDNSSGLISAYATGAQLLRCMGVQNETTGSFGLPTVWTPTTPVAKLPQFSIATQATF